MSAQTKKLYRSEKDRFIFGVCGGLGEYFNLDPVIVRLIFVVLTIFNGIGLVLYIILAVIIPDEKTGFKKNLAGQKEEKKMSLEERVETAAEEFGEKVEKAAEEFGQNAENVGEEIGQRSQKLAEEVKESGPRLSLTFGWLLILLGFFFLARIYFPHYLRLELVWPLVLIGIGFYVLARPRK